MFNNMMDENKNIGFEVDWTKHLRCYNHTQIDNHHISHKIDLHPKLKPILHHKIERKQHADSSLPLRQERIQNNDTIQLLVTFATSFHSNPNSDCQTFLQQIRCNNSPTHTVLCMELASQLPDFEESYQLDNSETHKN
jgi:hypothetical protein